MSDRPEGSGALFKNTHKEAGSNQPDYTGRLIVNGTEMRLAAWLKESQSGMKYMSVQMSEQREQVKKPEANFDATLEDDAVPF